jgi:hypothetical protein
MLDAMGIESRPALVNPYCLRTVRDWLPTPFAFTHVILLARVDGRDYWLDPTMTDQRGTLEHIHQPDYEVALVLDGGETGLVDMNLPPLEAPKRTVREQFDLSGGYDEPGRLTITTTCRGAAAEGLRGGLSQESREELEKSYVNHYASTYPDIRMTEPIQVEDDLNANVVTVTETYEVPGIWKESEDGATVQALFDPLELYGFIDTPFTRQRTMPLAVDHPAWVRLSTEVLLPDDWNVEPKSFHVEDDAIAFDYKIGYRARCMTLEYDYRTKQDFVPAEKSQEHIANLERIENELGYMVYDSSGAEVSRLHEINWTVGLIGLFSLVAALVLARKVYRYHPRPPDPLPLESRRQRFGGFLLVAAVIIVIQPPATLVNLCANYEPYTMTEWNSLTSPSSSGYHPLWQPVLLFELIANVFWVVFSSLMAVLFFQKRFTFPRVYSAYVVISFVLQSVDKLVYRVLPGRDMEGISEFASITFGAMLAISLYALYFERSRRVGNTFVRVLRDEIRPAGKSLQEA